MSRDIPLIKATFTPGRTASLLEELITQELNGQRPEKIFKREAWVGVAAEFNSRWGTNYPISSLKNHFNAKRSEYKVFEALRTASGAGWDDDEKRVTGSDEFWDRYLESHKAAKVFRKAGFPLLELMVKLEGSKCADDSMVHGTRVTKRPRLSQTTDGLTQAEFDLDDFGDETASAENRVFREDLTTTGAKTQDLVVASTPGDPGSSASRSEPILFHCGSGEDPDDADEPESNVATPAQPRAFPNLFASSVSETTNATTPNSPTATQAPPTINASTSQSEPRHVIRSHTSSKKSTRAAKNPSAQETMAEFNKLKARSLDLQTVAQVEAAQEREEDRAERRAQQAEDRADRQARTELRMRRLDIMSREQSGGLEHMGTAMELFGTSVNAHIEDPKLQMAAAVVLQDTKLACFFVKLPSNLRWPWLIAEAEKAT